IGFPSQGSRVRSPLPAPSFKISLFFPFYFYGDGVITVRALHLNHIPIPPGVLSTKLHRIEIRKDVVIKVTTEPTRIIAIQFKRLAQFMIRMARSLLSRNGSDKLDPNLFLFHLDPSLI